MQRESCCAKRQLFGLLRVRRQFVRIVAVALKVQATGKLYTLPSPARHHHVIAKMSAAGLKHPVTKGTIQGFLADDGNFYNRKESFVIAVKAGQTTKTIREGHKESLCSEDLW